MTTQSNFSLVERVRGNGPAISQDELMDLLAELDAWRGYADKVGVYEPESIEPAFSALDANQENPDHADYDDLKEFFDDCVQALEDEGGRYPQANQGATMHIILELLAVLAALLTFTR